MPTVEYRCPKCGHRFSRVFLRGETAGSSTCPECEGIEVVASQEASGLFDGIATFSDLAKDTN